MAFEDSFKLAVKDWLVKQGVDAVKVFLVTQDTFNGGYCETCSYETIEVDITYTDSTGQSRLYTYYGDMAEFIAEL